MFERALALDPNNVDAIVGAARTESAFAWSHMSDDRATRLAAAEAACRQGVVDRARKGAGARVSGRSSAFTPIGSRRELPNSRGRLRSTAISLRLTRSSVLLSASSGAAKKPKAMSTMRSNSVLATRLPTFGGPIWVSRASSLARTKKPSRNCARRSRSAANFHPAHFYLAAALAGLGRPDEARVAAKEGLSIDPTFTIRRYRADAPSDNSVFLAARQRIYEMMRKVGVPEG